MLLLLMMVMALTTPALVTNRPVLSGALIMGVFLTLWARFTADWLRLRRKGQLGMGTVVVVICDFLWLTLLVGATGGLQSPFAPLLLVPVLFSAALFSRLRIAIVLVTGLVTFGYTGFAIAADPGVTESWQLTGMLLTTMALAWLAYAMCLVLERERRTNELVVRHMSEGVLLVDSTRRIVLANEQIEACTAVPHELIIGAHVQDVIRNSGSDALASILADLGSASGKMRATIRDITIEGPETFDLCISTIPIAGPTGKPVGWVVISQDVTAVRSVVRMKENGISMLSHEIRSPLTTLRVAASMFSALADKMRDDKGSRFAEIIQAETARLLRIAGELLNISVLEDPDCCLNKEETDLHALLKRARRLAELRARSKDISVHMTFIGPMPRIWADSDRLGDAIQRLFDNAIKYTDIGGDIRLTAVPKNGHIRISVSDTGRGIPADQYEVIFDKFAQLENDAQRDRSERGAGLGLYIVKRVVELHDGWLELESEPGRGSTFTVLLPVGAKGLDGDDAFAYDHEQLGVDIQEHVWS